MRDVYLPGSKSDIRELNRRGPEVKFFFSAHGRPEDYKGMKDAFDESDVYVVEAHAWTRADLNALRAIAAGEQEPKHIRDGRQAKDVFELEEEWLYKTGKRVEIVDVPEGHPLAEEDDGTADLDNAANLLLYNGNIGKARAKLLAAAQKNGKYIEKKDAFIQKRLRTLIDEMKQEDAPPAKILVQMGSSHTKLFHDFAQDHSAARIRNRIRFDSVDELMRVYRFDKEPSEKQVVQALAELMLKKIFLDELFKRPYLDRAGWLRERTKDIDETKLQALAQGFERRFFERVVMEDERDTSELEREMFSQTWRQVMGTDFEI